MTKTLEECLLAFPSINHGPIDKRAYNSALRDLAAAIRATPAPEPQPEVTAEPVALVLKAKALEWSAESGLGFYYAKTPFGQYSLMPDLGDYSRQVMIWRFGSDEERKAGNLASAKIAAQADYDSRIRSSSITVLDDDEAYEIGKREGYEDAVQDIDLLTGGDGEYRYCMDGDPGRHTPDAEAMKQRIVDRFATPPVVEEAVKAETRVQGLLWEDCGEDMGFCCDTILGRYWIEPDALASKSWQLRLITIEHETELELILAQGHIAVDTLHPIAQADFTARILSALSFGDASGAAQDAS